MKHWRTDDGGVIAGVLLLVVVAGLAYGGYRGYQYWDDNKETTPPAAAVPQGSEELSGKGVTLVIPRGWSEEKVSDKEIQKRFDSYVQAFPDEADATGIDQTTDPAESMAFFAIEDKEGKGREDLNVEVNAAGEIDLQSAQSYVGVHLERGGASKVKWQTTTLGGVEARQVDFQQKVGDVTLYQREYIVIGDDIGATLTFSSLRPIDDKGADAIADTMRVD